MGTERNPVAVQFGKDLRRFRDGVGISLEERGFLSALHRTEISLLEHGLREPKLDTIIKLADARRDVKELCDGISWKVEDSDLKNLSSETLAMRPVSPSRKGSGDER